MADFEVGKFVLIDDEHTGLNGVFLIEEEIKDPLCKSSDKWFILVNTETMHRENLPLWYIQQFGREY